MIYVHNINPIIAELGPFVIRWYGLSYIFGIFFCILLLKKLSNKVVKRFDIPFESYFSHIALGIILGGKLGYILIYDLHRLFHNPSSILETFFSGMSFHGGILGVAFSLYLLSKRYKVPFFDITDLASTVAPIGLFFGRIANFINGELYGRPTDQTWGIVFHDPILRHPSQLYEAFFEGVLLFCIMLWCFYRLHWYKTSKLLTATFLIFYSIFRIFIEFFRTPDAHIGFFSVFTLGQILSLITLSFGILLVAKAIK